MLCKTGSSSPPANDSAYVTSVNSGRYLLKGAHPDQGYDNFYAQFMYLESSKLPDNAYWGMMIILRSAPVGKYKVKIRDGYGANFAEPQPSWYKVQYNDIDIHWEYEKIGSMTPWGMSLRNLNLKKKTELESCLNIALRKNRTNAMTQFAIRDIEVTQVV